MLLLCIVTITIVKTNKFIPKNCIMTFNMNCLTKKTVVPSIMPDHSQGVYITFPSLYIEFLNRFDFSTSTGYFWNFTCQLHFWTFILHFWSLFKNFLETLSSDLEFVVVFGCTLVPTLSLGNVLYIIGFSILIMCVIKIICTKTQNFYNMTFHDSLVCLLFT